MQHQKKQRAAHTHRCAGSHTSKFLSAAKVALQVRAVSYLKGEVEIATGCTVHSRTCTQRTDKK